MAIMEIDQTTLNAMMSGFGGLLAWYSRTISEQVKDLKDKILDLEKRLSSVEVNIAGEYIKRSEFETSVRALFNKLDRIEDKIDKKVDKT